jgi:hypothetical protein
MRETLRESQVMFCLEPISQFSPPSGDIILIHTGRGAMVKLASLISNTAGFKILVTFILALVVAGPVTLQFRLPSLVVEPMIVVHVAPSSRDSSILTSPVTLIELQVMAWVEPISQFSPPLGDVTVIDAGAGMMTTVTVPTSSAFTCPGTRDRDRDKKNADIIIFHVPKAQPSADIYQRNWRKVSLFFPFNS